jgi:hypothetical protein
VTRPRDASLARDERGAVMIVGLFAAMFLFGAAWFVLGVGDAVTHRETMQDAADSGAYFSAVLHARAMNLIALLNLVKLSVAATLTSLLAVIVGASKTIAWINSSPANLAAFGAALPLLTAIHASTLADLQSIRGDADAVLRASDRAQRALVDRLPEVAATQAREAAVAYGSPVSNGFATPRPMPVRLGEPLELCQRAVPPMREPALSAFDNVSPEPARQRARTETDTAMMPSCLGLGVAGMELEEGVQLGGEQLQLRYFSLGGPPVERGEAGVEIATWGRVQQNRSTDGGVAVAQAEYYFDGQGQAAQEQAQGLWELGWRARFRRVRSQDLAGEMTTACSQATAPCGETGTANTDIAERVAH